MPTKRQQPIGGAAMPMATLVTMIAPKWDRIERRDRCE
jgi:hypothetical protein